MSHPILDALAADLQQLLDAHPSQGRNGWTCRARREDSDTIEINATNPQHPNLRPTYGFKQLTPTNSAAIVNHVMNRLAQWDDAQQEKAQ